jgi:hypothetical protein
MLTRLSEGYFLAGIESDPSEFPLARFNGALGVLDWYLHGQVSGLWKQGRIGEASPSLFASGNGLHAIVIPWALASQPKKVSETIAGLQRSKLLILESTFPKDILGKLTQNLKKESVDCEMITLPES